MSDTSSIICLDDIVEAEILQTNEPTDNLPSEQLWAVVDYVEFNNFTVKEELHPTEKPADAVTVPNTNNVDNNSNVSSIISKIDEKVKETTEIISVCLDDSDEDENLTLMEIDAECTTTCFLTPLYEVENSNVCKEDTNRKYECKTCEKFFFSRKALFAHYKSHYKEEREEKKKNRINCPVCNQYFNHAKDFDWHEPECKGRHLAKQSNRAAKRRITRSQKSS